MLWEAMTSRGSDAGAWPALPLESWQATKDTLHLWTQMAGKLRLALTPMQNHWWQVALYPTARGLTTSAMPYAQGSVEARFDFIDHVLALETSSGGVRRIALAPRSVADFYTEFIASLRMLGVEARIRPHPSEIADPLPFERDEAHRSYDGEAARRFWRILTDSAHVLAVLRSGFLGKCSPVHFWWGGFDLACTRFSGRRAPVHPGGVPGLPDWVTREGYSHECISAGWWPGGGSVNEPAFYAYAYPEPPGFAEAKVAPEGAYYHPQLREFILPYSTLRTAANPAAALLAFLEGSYAAAADLGGWDRASLERSPGDPLRTRLGTGSIRKPGA